MIKVPCSIQSEDLQNPNPDIHELFAHYNKLYFDNQIGACTVKWSSRRMTRCAGICCYQNNGECCIRLSEPLLKFRSAADVKDTLLHEMIHAYMFLMNLRDDSSHGTIFEYFMKYINDSKDEDIHRPKEGYKVTPFHSFLEEVAYYEKHHWECDKCGDEIRRMINRKPQPADCSRRFIDRNNRCCDQYCHWHMHSKYCNGHYVKTKEPSKKTGSKRSASPSRNVSKRTRSKITLDDWLEPKKSEVSESMRVACERGITPSTYVDVDGDAILDMNVVGVIESDVEMIDLT